MNVIAIPAIEPGLLERHRQEHRASSDALGQLEPEIAAFTSAWLRGRSVEALAGVRASTFGPAGPLLLPVPRRYLGAESRQRLAGVERALSYVEHRAAARDEFPALVGWESPFVIHALAGVATSRRGGSLGIFRTTDSRWGDQVHPYRPPSAELVPELVAATLTWLTQADAPPAVLAPWLAFVWMTIHPFEDGNGRTARLLHQLVASAGLHAGGDRAIAEMWVVHRHDYHERLQAGQLGAHGYDPDMLDAAPFVEASLAWSTEGAAITARRVATIGQLADALPGSQEARLAVLAAVLDRGITPDALPTGSYAARLDALERATAKGSLVRAHPPASRRPPAAHPERPWYAPTEATWQIVGRIMERSLPQPGHLA